ncbi:hypothetical protein [Paraliobacillus sediminis]|uniref:hypothetical protein n=1 Tax=Paraliobacillus sediminis TaxID=1885916 RepID=UPI000E3E87B7
MYMCPICNGFAKVNTICPSCNTEMDEKGRLIEQLGDYAPYLDNEGMKLFDGDSTSKTNHTCVHVFTCPTCEIEQVKSIEEVII